MERKKEHSHFNSSEMMPEIKFCGKELFSLFSDSFLEPAYTWLQACIHGFKHVYKHVYMVYT